MPHRIIKVLRYLVLAGSLTIPVISIAAVGDPSPSFKDWVERLQKQALSNGISNGTLQLAFLDLAPLEPVADFRRNRPEISLEQYLAARLSPNQTRFQKNLLQRYSNILFEIGHLLSVEPEALVAIWTIDNLDETDKQRFNAIELLVSSSFHQPRNKKLQTELLAALKLLETGQVNPTRFTSNAHGLLGTLYFTPRMLHKLGIDYDNDGQMDIWKNYADIFATMANRLSSIGWQSKQPWGMEVVLPEAFPDRDITTNIQHTVQYWQNLEVTRTNGDALPDDLPFSSIIRPDPASGKTYLVLDNYFALLRWKRSPAFAIAVGLMMERLKTTQ